MRTITTGAGAATSADSGARSAARGWFFQACSALLLLAVLVGFSRTFFLRAWFPDNPIGLSPMLVVHGIALTAWFVLFFVQALLVQRGREATHRRLGAFGGVVVAVLVPSCLAVVFGIVQSWRAAGIDVEAQRPLLSMIVWGNLGALFAFVVLFARGMFKRRTPDAHKRLMLLASISIMSPAVSRIALLPVFAGMDLVLLTVLGVLSLLAAVALYDLATRRRLQRETLWAVPFVLLVHFGPVFVLPGTAINAWLMAWMG